MGRAVVVVGMLGLLLAAVAWPGPGLLATGTDAVSTGASWLLLAAGALALLGPRPLRLAALAPTLVGWAVLGWAAALALGTGLPSGAVAVLVAGGAVTGVGVVARTSRSEPPTRLRVALAALVAAGVTVGLAVGLDAAAWRYPVVSSPAAAPGAPPAVETRPERLAWTWRDPVGTATVLAAGPGVVVARRDGVILGLDGRSGTVRWAAGRAGASAAVSVTPDRRTVVALLRAGRDRSDEGGRTGARLAVLDADTGAVRWEDDLGGFSALTDRVLVLADRGGLLARSLADGGVAWTAPAPDPTCSVAPGAPVASAVAVLEWRCREGSAPRTLVQAHDAETGSPRWAITAERLDPPVTGRGLVTAPDGGVLRWDTELRDARDDGPLFATFLVDPVTGGLERRPGGEAIRLSAGSRPVVGRVPPQDERIAPPAEQALTPTGPVPLPASVCAPVFTLAVVATADAAVRLCAGVGGPRGAALQLDDRDAVPLPIGSGRYRDVAADTTAPDPNRPEGFAVPAPGAFVVGVRQEQGSTLLGYVR